MEITDYVVNDDCTVTATVIFSAKEICLMVQNSITKVIVKEGYGTIEPVVS